MDRATIPKYNSKTTTVDNILGLTNALHAIEHERHAFWTHYIHSITHTTHLDRLSFNSLCNLSHSLTVLDKNIACLMDNCLSGKVFKKTRQIRKKTLPNHINYTDYLVREHLDEFTGLLYKENQPDVLQQSINETLKDENSDDTLVPESPLALIVEADHTAGTLHF